MRLTKNSKVKSQRELVLTISMFLLNQEVLRSLFWSVKTVHYDRMNQVVKIGINTTSGKLGTTLAKLRKTSKYLSDYLFDQGLTFRKTKIHFFVDKEDEQIERIYNIINKVNA